MSPGQRTRKLLSAEELWPPELQVTVTGHEPTVVRVPTLHVQLTLPVLLAVLGPSPAALEGPDLYSTVIVHAAPAFVRAAMLANEPRETGEVRLVIRTVIEPPGALTGVGRGVAPAGGGAVPNAPQR
jgi:hypothetical protein